MIDVIVDTVNTCPMSCKYCGTRSNEYKKQELSKEVIKLIMNAAKQEQEARVFFGGGLFFHHSKWKQILDYNKKIKANIVIDTPLSSSSLRSIQLLTPQKYHYSISISYWGLAQHTTTYLASTLFTCQKNSSTTPSNYKENC